MWTHWYDPPIDINTLRTNEKLGTNKKLRMRSFIKPMNWFYEASRSQRFAKLLNCSVLAKNSSGFFLFCHTFPPEWDTWAWACQTDFALYAQWQKWLNPMAGSSKIIHFVLLFFTCVIKTEFSSLLWNIFLRLKRWRLYGLKNVCLH